MAAEGSTLIGRRQDTTSPLTSEDSVLYMSITTLKRTPGVLRRRKNFEFPSAPKVSDSLVSQLTVARSNNSEPVSPPPCDKVLLQLCGKLDHQQCPCDARACQQEAASPISQLPNQSLERSSAWRPSISDGIISRRLVRSMASFVIQVPAPPAASAIANILRQSFLLLAQIHWTRPRPWSDNRKKILTNQ